MRKARIFLGAMFLIVALVCGACAAYGFMMSSEGVQTVTPDYNASAEDVNAGVQNAVADNSANVIALIVKVGNFENTILTIFAFVSVVGTLTFLGLSIFNFASSGEGYVKANAQPQQVFPTGVYQAVPSGNTGVYPIVTANTGVYQAVPSGNTGIYPIVQAVPQEQEPVVEQQGAEKVSKRKKSAEPVKEADEVQEEAPVQDIKTQEAEPTKEVEIEPENQEE